MVEGWDLVVVGKGGFFGRRRVRSGLVGMTRLRGVDTSVQNQNPHFSQKKREAGHPVPRFARFAQFEMITSVEFVVGLGGFDFAGYYRERIRNRLIAGPMIEIEMTASSH